MSATEFFQWHSTAGKTDAVASYLVVVTLDRLTRTYRAGLAVEAVASCRPVVMRSLDPTLGEIDDWLEEIVASRPVTSCSRSA